MSYQLIRNRGKVCFSTDQTKYFYKKKVDKGTAGNVGKVLQEIKKR